ncbi:MAG TPA: hypothetical protein VGR87_00275 [Candidatus Limnocylindria bacterium]|nr:hypothetical protein [Candidatus Limnocylindria bacterium]
MATGPLGTFPVPIAAKEPLERLHASGSRTRGGRPPVPGGVRIPLEAVLPSARELTLVERIGDRLRGRRGGDRAFFRREEEG